MKAFDEVLWFESIFVKEILSKVLFGKLLWISASYLNGLGKSEMLKYFDIKC